MSKKAKSVSEPYLPASANEMSLGASVLIFCTTCGHKTSVFSFSAAAAAATAATATTTTTAAAATATTTATTTTTVRVSD